MKNYFHTVDVSINNVPDLTKAPFHLAAPGICGYPKLLDVGGQQHLSPVPQLDHKYDLRTISSLIDMTEALYIGAGAGPFYEVDTNSEENPQNFLIEPLKSTHFALLGNFYASKGMPGKAIRIAVSKSKVENTDLLEIIRSCLKEDYKDTFIGLGGVFVLKTGTAKVHVMPDFCPDPLDSEEKMINWLKFYHIPAPLTCLGVLVNKDFKDFALRSKHAHCFQTTMDHSSVIDPDKVNPDPNVAGSTGSVKSNTTTSTTITAPSPSSSSKHTTFNFDTLKYGGHYHYDTVPEESSYEGYFVPVQTVCRIDQPGTTDE